MRAIPHALLSATVLFSAATATAQTQLPPAAGTTPLPRSGTGERLYVATYAPPSLALIDADTQTILRQTSVSESPFALAADPIRNRVYVSFDTGTLAAVHGDTLAVRNSVSIPNLLGAVEVTDDGQTLVGVTTFGIVIVDLPALTVRHDVAVGSGSVYAGYLAFTSDSATVWFSDTYGNQVTQLDLATGAELQSVAVGFGPTGLDLSADDTRLFVANNQEFTLSVVDTALGLEIAREPSGIWPFELRVHSNGTVYVTGSFGAELTRHNLGGAVLDTHSLSFEPWFMHELSDGKLALALPWLSLFDPASGEETPFDITPIGSAIDVTSKP